ncbi:maltose alpha-D-glucosyltransferase [Streptomyces sp. DSM 44917]|uniref:maltose alpha-D-glucosyltransferase n=1 Tax=Streptomyces boetiae TaxID=3075541 RepID=A0ABU2L509_9ACTN|nr:maltose alpha-D-glucosyltransferase [Streptomyces sp. DSM 44917]MDT0306633.1 maltose alpha-D-glucosyltransferase [Streptomyces sp. DSM 44917]
MSERVARGIILEPEAADFEAARPAPVEPGWYKRAVFYEVLVRAFHDSDGDGIGDLRGLTARLDHLTWLGVDCLWLPPFYASPLRDGGYDISDYRSVLPEFGTIDDFIALLDAAHARGIRVITDMVMNHTSDEHPWFQDSRRNPDGPYGDFYVWADDDSAYRDARIIFVDTERSNWTHDPVRGQYYWHRFFSHQPDLNYENPRVQDAMLDALRFWLDLGIDGFRLDAVPYLFEEEGTDCENLPATHAFLKAVRKTVDDEYPGRVLLAEANQWPQDAVAYFGDPGLDGDECHMAFHFPLMPRIFMGLRQESGVPIAEVLATTPRIPADGQWGIFLRNHDELSLEMVTDDERAYMYEQYAPHPRMRANVGIRRRLAPLLDNDRGQVELATALLLSLPGSPILYYGDEIGMGDNIWLADRDAVRTPMQWSSGPNAGFSTASPELLYLPVVTSPGHAPQEVNVEAQYADPGSLLHWTRRMLGLRRAHPAFGEGSFEPLHSPDPAVLAFLRDHAGTDGERDRVLCVYNLATSPRSVSLDVPDAAGGRLTLLTGPEGAGAEPAVGPDGAVRIELAARGVGWFSLGGGSADGSERGTS